MFNICFVVSVIIVILLINNCDCFSCIKKWCRINVFECMFNEDKLFKRTMYGNGYRINYDKCK